jgi:hypothetical protein
MSIAKGGDGVFPRIRLAHLYLKQHLWHKSAQEAMQAIKIMPLDVSKISRRLFWQVTCSLKKLRTARPGSTLTLR